MTGGGGGVATSVPGDSVFEDDTEEEGDDSVTGDAFALPCLLDAGGTLGRVSRGIGSFDCPPSKEEEHQHTHGVD